MPGTKVHQHKDATKYEHSSHVNPSGSSFSVHQSSALPMKHLGRFLQSFWVSFLQAQNNLRNNLQSSGRWRRLNGWRRGRARNGLPQHLLAHMSEHRTRHLS